MVKFFIIILRLISGLMLGSVFGVIILLTGRLEQGVGLAIIGGVLGMTLAISNVLYEASATKTLSRGFLLFLKLTFAKIIPGGAAIISVEEEKVESRYHQTAHPVTLENRINIGMKVGVILAVVPAVLIAVLIQDTNRDPDPIILVLIKKLIIVISFIAFIGGGYGAAIGALSLPGIHRRNILIGAIVGFAIGFGLSIAINPGSKISSRQVYMFICGCLSYFGMLCGLFSSDNYEPKALDNSEETFFPPEELIKELVLEASILCSDCGFKNKAEWFEGKLEELNTPTLQNHTLLELKNYLAETGSFCELSFDPPREYRFSKELVNLRKLELIKKMRETINLLLESS